MKNEAQTPSVNLFPIMALSVLTLLCAIAAVVMLVGLHNKVKASPSVSATVNADEIGNISLSQDSVGINLMKRNENGKVEKVQEISIPLESFIRGFERQKKFMDRMIEENVITSQ